MLYRAIFQKLFHRKLLATTVPTPSFFLSAVPNPSTPLRTLAFDSNKKNIFKLRGLDTLALSTDLQKNGFNQLQACAIAMNLQNLFKRMLEACDKKYVSKEQQFNADREFKSTFDADYKKIINEWETPSVNDISEIYLKHHKEIDEIDHRHQKEIEEINVRHEKEINEIGHRHQEEITEIYKQVLVTILVVMGLISGKFIIKILLFSKPTSSKENI